MFSTPSTTILESDEFKDVYPPSEDSFLFLDALEQDLKFLNSCVKPSTSLEVGCGSGVLTTHLSQLLSNRCFHVCVDISTQVCRIRSIQILGMSGIEIGIFQQYFAQ